MQAGDGVVFLVKSDLLPYPIPAPLILCCIKSPPYVDLSQLIYYRIKYFVLNASNLGVLLNENVCFVLELFIEDEFIYLNEATELRQNCYFIKFIIIMINSCISYYGKNIKHKIKYNITYFILISLNAFNF